MTQTLSCLALALLLLAPAPAARAGERELDRSAQELVELLHGRKWSRLARRYYVRNVRDYRRLFPGNAGGLTNAQIEDDIILGRNSFMLEAGLALRDSGVSLDKWTYLKTFHVREADEEEGRVIISLFKSGPTGVDRLDISLEGIIDGDAIVLFGESVIDLERALGSD